jgi:hypothetical protein
VDGGASRERSSLDQIQSPRLAQRAEQAGPVADHHRMDY